MWFVIPESVSHQTIFDSVRDAFYFMQYPLPFGKPSPVVTTAAINQHFKNACEGVQIMAEKSGKSKVTPTASTDLKWINRNLTEEEKAHHDTQEKTPGDLGVLTFKLVMQGYNIRVAWDTYSKCYQANIVPFQPDNPNFGYALSARGVTPQRAVSLLLYKHYAVFNENWTAHYKAPANSFEG